MGIFLNSKLHIFTKRFHKHLGIFVIITIISNFSLFPVHAADEDFETSFSESKLETIQAPSSQKKLFEEINNNKKLPLTNIQDETSEFAKNFVITEPITTPLISLLNARSGTSLNSGLSVGNSKMVTLTAYNSEVEQCDGDPCTTANGFNVCAHGIEDTVAANFLPLGTKIMIPDLFGNRIFIVRDRTSRKYSDRVDVWMIKKHDALQFGKRHSRIVVIE
jgi:3D (Asp-Asp-Asp) domain-containing protein